MALNYDFDMVSGVTGQQAVAMFRDPATVAALGCAPQGLQDYLRASLFGTETHHGGAPAGRYPQADEAARIAVIEALAENVGKFDLPRPDDTQPVGDDFHLPTFFAAVAEAEPVGMQPIQPEPEAIATEPQTAALTADTSMADFIAAEERETASRIADTVAIYGEKVDALIAAPVADDPPGSDHPAPATTAPATTARDANEMPPAFRFRLPALPRWITAGAALTVLGVAVGTAMI